MPEYVIVDSQFTTSEYVAVDHSGEFGDRAIKVTDKISGNVMVLDLNHAWWLTSELTQAVERAAMPRTPDTDYTGPCPSWCWSRDHTGTFAEVVHWIRVGSEIPTSVMPYETWGPPDLTPTFVQVQLSIPAVDNPPPTEVWLEVDAIDDAIRFTLDEAEKVARTMLEAVALAREAEAREASERRRLSTASR